MKSSRPSLAIPMQISNGEPPSHFLCRRDEAEMRQVSMCQSLCRLPRTSFPLPRPTTAFHRGETRARTLARTQNAEEPVRDLTPIAQPAYR